MQVSGEPRFITLGSVPVPILQVEDRQAVLLRYRLVQDRVVVGRSDASDLALPSETVSRSHCSLERRGEDWWVTDLSRHGTRLDGQPVGPGGARLTGSSVIELGMYRLRVVHDEGPAEHSVTRMVAAADYEEQVENSGGRITARRAALRFSEGPRAGEVLPLQRVRAVLGGEGADLEVDEALPRDAAVVRVVRGRVMVEPSACPVFVSGLRAPGLMPVFHGEEIRVGDAILEVIARFEEEHAHAEVGFGDLQGSSPPMMRLYHLLDRVARHDAPVLLVGESGTGKELAARALHQSGPRCDGPFVAINCAALPERLVESELFGHEKGSFTGATQRHVGAFARAEGGTLFLDEIGEMSPDTQAKLLRALESGEVRAVGAQVSTFPDVRVVAATNRDLGRMVERGLFRGDLLHRLAVLALRMPALRERRRDVPELVRALLARDHPGARISKEALDVLCAYDWPGNVRELRNVLTRAVVLGGNPISPDALSFSPWSFDLAPGLEEEPTSPEPNDDEDEAEERVKVLAALREHKGNRARAARALGMPRTTLVYKLMKLGVTD